MKPSKKIVIQSQWRVKLHEIIFEADTKMGKWFDIGLIVCIIVSVIVVMLDSVEHINDLYGEWLYGLEWFFTILFTIEYVLRLICIGRPVRYALSFFGIVDLLSIVPTYLDYLFPGTHFLLVIRVLRVLRIFRILKLVKFLTEAKQLTVALRASRHKILVFILTVLTLTVILGSFMYIIESKESGFTSIPKSIYWAIVTLTTVGYGDIAPSTILGQIFASLIMIMGYGILAVPTGIVTVELSRVERTVSTQACTECSAEGHDMDADYCKYCGSEL